MQPTREPCPSPKPPRPEGPHSEVRLRPHVPDLRPTGRGSSPPRAPASMARRSAGSPALALVEAFGPGVAGNPLPHPGAPLPRDVGERERRVGPSCLCTMPEHIDLVIFTCGRRAPSCLPSFLPEREGGRAGGRGSRRDKKRVDKREQLSATDILALATMKNAAKCDT